jgi:uncharacterized membrane protein YfcA
MFSEFILPGTPKVVFWLFVCVGILIQGISKSGFAGGAAILSVPLMMLVMPVDKVAATMLPLLVLCDLNAIYFYRHDKDWKLVIRMYIPACAGILLGGLVWWLLGKAGVQQYEGFLKRFVGSIAIVFSIYIFVRETAMHWVSRFKFGTGATLGFGLAAGFCSTICHAAGPVVGLYVFAQGLGKTLFVGTTAWIFTFINITKLPVYFGVGLVKTDILLFDLLLVWLVPVGSVMGKWMHQRVSESTFNRIILVLTLIAGVQLLFNINVVQNAYKLLFSIS